MPPPLPNHDIDTACRNAAAAFAALAQLTPDARTAILDAIAAALDARRDEILTTCSEETALTIDELTPEFARTTGTLRLFADLVRDGSWVRAAIDTPSTSPIGPNHDLRSLLTPLGPVAVFGSSNFPLAYGVCGGDTASALAAGCPVIIKEHPAHPRTGRLLASIAQHAITHAFDEPDAQARGLVRSATHTHLLQYIANEDPKDLSIAQTLVQHPDIKAVGFTGSIPGGVAIEKLARERDVPIPVFAEMGSTNPVFVTPGALQANAAKIGSELALSILARVGQQCTKPGLLFVPAIDTDKPLYEAMRQSIQAAPLRRLLAPWIAEHFYQQVSRSEDFGSSRASAFSSESGVRLTGSGMTDSSPQSVLLETKLDLLCRDAELRAEIFGPASMWVVVDNWDDLAKLDLPGSLTLSVYFDERDPEDVARARSIVEQHGRRAGRITFNGPPTGVRVATSMVHGGPFPATNRPDTTAVGPRAIERWCRPICFQNCPDALLPPELQNANPRNLWRTVNGELSRAGR